MSSRPRRPRGQSVGQFKPISRPETSDIQLEETDTADEKREQRLCQTLAELRILFDDSASLVERGRINFDSEWAARRAAKNIITELAETATRLPASYQAAHSEIEWHLLAGMRNRLVHAYQDTDYEAVWDAIAVDIPQIRMQLNL